MFDLSDAFVALPGGLGTFEELFEVVSWAHLGIHDKPIATFDVDDFWQPMRTMLERTVSIGFIRASRLGLIANVSNPEALLPVLRTHDFVARRGHLRRRPVMAWRSRRGIRVPMLGYTRNAAGVLAGADNPRSDDD